MSKNMQNQNVILKEMINSSWSGIGIININTKFLYINKAFSPLLGYSSAELLDFNFIDLVAQDNKQQFLDLIKENSQNRYVNNLQLSCNRKDGGIVFLDITISLMQDNKHIVIDASDITQTVSEYEIYDKYLIQTQLDKDGNINKASEAYCRLSGYLSEELVGMSFIHEQTKDKEQLWKNITSSKEYSGVIVNKTKKGTFFWVESVIKPQYNKYGDIIGYTAVMFDITNEMSLEEKKKDLLKAIVDRDEKLNIMKSTMRLVAHEWRQPLNVISLEVQNLILKYQFDENVVTQETIDHLTTVTNKIEELSKIIDNFQHTTELRESKAKTNISSILEKALMNSNALKENIIINNKHDLTFFTYKNALSKSISQILDNAQDAINNTNVENKSILINTYQEKNNIVFDIINSAGNIPEDILDNIFIPYFSTKDKNNGVGLSLYNCKMMIELHLKGIINVMNLDNNQIKFQIKVPRKDSE